MGERKELSFKELNEIFSYRSDGELVWRIEAGCARPGRIAGSIAYHNGHRYKRVVYNKVPYLVHRLVYMYFHGVMPDGDIVHKDGNRLNNKIDNLLCVPREKLRRYGKVDSRNKTGINGISICSNSGKFRCQIRVGKKTKCLGLFENLRDAALAIWRAEKENNYNVESSAERYLRENFPGYVKAVEEER